MHILQRNIRIFPLIEGHIFVFIPVKSDGLAKIRKLTNPLSLAAMTKIAWVPDFAAKRKSLYNMQSSGAARGSEAALRNAGRDFPAIWRDFRATDASPRKSFNYKNWMSVKE
jgi:acetaldehyde dehydrogenase (acetylating)